MRYDNRYYLDRNLTKAEFKRLQRIDYTVKVVGILVLTYFFIDSFMFALSKI